MAGKLYYVINASSTTFSLTNTIAGKTQQPDLATLKANSLTNTGGAGDNFIQIPDATPPYKFFTRDHTQFAAGNDNLYLYQTQGTNYWLVNQAPTSSDPGTEFENSKSFDKAFVVISQQNGSWTMSLYNADNT